MLSHNDMYRAREVSVMQIAGLFVKWFIFFVLIALVPTSLFALGVLPDVPIDRTPLALVSLIVGFQFGAWLRSSGQSQVAGPRLLRSVLAEIEDLCSKSQSLFRFFSRR